MRIFPQVGPLRLVLRLVLLAVAAGVFAFYVPTPYTLNAPGHAEDLSEIVHVAGKPPSPPGHLYMTTVVHERANLLFCLYALMDPEAQLLPAEYSVPRVLPARPKGPELPGSFNPENMMAQSKYIARVQALRYMGYKLDIESHGAQVLDFLDGSRARGKLRRNDVIVGMNGRPIKSVYDLHRILMTKEGGQDVRLKVTREKSTLVVTVPLMDVHGRALIGIVTQDAVSPVALPVAIEIATHNVNGASAGLMFTLAILDQMLPQGLARGQRIAGTGTMSLHGDVGPIEGVRLKVIAAERAGAEIFLAPVDNANEASAAATKLKIIPVETLQDAVKQLGGPPPEPPGSAGKS